MQNSKKTQSRKSLFLSLALLAFLNYSCSSDAQSGNVQSDIITKDSVPAEAVKIVRFKLSFLGDIMQHSLQITAAHDKKNNIYDYEPSFRYVAPLFKNDDLTIGNLEFTTNNRGVYTGYPRFRAPDTIVQVIKDAGVDMLTTCNNHSNDDDGKGIVHTLETIQKAGFYYTGTFVDSTEREQKYPLIVTVKKDGVELRLAFINYTYDTNGIPTQKPTVVNLIDTVQMAIDIAKAKAAEPDMIIAIMHWGYEYQLNESKVQRELADFLYRNDVPVVIGGHPHVIQPIKVDTFINAQGEKATGLCTYSLGNFISNQEKTNTDIGLIFELELEKQSHNKTVKIVDHSYILAWRYIFQRHLPLEQRVYTVVPVSAFENDSTNYLKMQPAQLQAMKTTAERMRKHLQKYQSKERIVKFEEIVQDGMLKINERNPYTKPIAPTASENTEKTK